MEKKLKKFSTLIEFGKKVARETKLEKLLLLLMDETKEILDADRCTVFLYDKERKELWSKIGHGFERKEIRFSVHKGIAGEVVRKGKVINIQDAYKNISAKSIINPGLCFISRIVT